LWIIPTSYTYEFHWTQKCYIGRIFWLFQIPIG